MAYSFAVADASEQLTAQRRDEEQMRRIYDKMSDCVLRLFGERVWMRWHRWLPAVASLIYLTATNLRVRQTVGEEYVGLVQVGADGRFPRLASRLLLVLAEFVVQAPLLNVLIMAMTTQHPLVHQTILQLNAVFGIHHIHSAWFFLFNSFYLRLSKRLSSIRYLSLRPQLNSVPPILFQLIGFATLAQFAVVLMSSIAKLVKQQSVAVCDERSHKSEFFCKICSTKLNKVRRPVCFPCGHLLCSDCLVSLCSRDKGNSAAFIECPFCRVKFPLHRIIFPLNL